MQRRARAGRRPTVWETHPQLIDELRIHWTAGLSIREIARRLNKAHLLRLTPNAVVGKVHRLKLPMRPIHPNFVRRPVR